MLLSEAEAENKVVEALSELNVHNVVTIPKIGPLDFSISNAVIYMWIAAVLVFVFFVVVSRRARKHPDAAQSVAEMLIGFATGHLTGQYGEKGKKYYYLVLTIFCYIFTMNIIGLIPKPEALVPYTPTANINVTLGMALVVFVVTHFMGVKFHGIRYAKAFMAPPGMPKAMAPILNVLFVVVEIMGAMFRPLSLAIRLYGNTIAGHLIILVMLGLLAQFANWIIAVGPLVFVFVIMAFEIFVAFIQAYIFSLLSVIYIEGAIYAGH